MLAKWSRYAPCSYGSVTQRAIEVTTANEPGGPREAYTNPHSLIPISSISCAHLHLSL